MPPNITLIGFYDGLLMYDWQYPHSDMASQEKPRAWDRIEELRRWAAPDPEYQAMLAGFEAHYSSGIGFGTEQVPLPEKPES